MITLDDGYSIEGTIDTSIININDKWTRIIILTTDLNIEEIENLCLNNLQFKDELNVYISNGYIKTVFNNKNKTKTWLKLKYKYERKDNEINDLKQQVLELQTYIANKEYENLLNKGGIK